MKYPALCTAFKAMQKNESYEMEDVAEKETPQLNSGTTTPQHLHQV